MRAGRHVDGHRHRDGRRHHRQRQRHDAGRRHPDRQARGGLRGHRGAGRFAVPEPAELLAAWKADPAGTAIGGGSKGGTDHLLAGLVAEAYGIDTTKINYIAFSGGGEALNALLANTVAASVSGYNEFADQIEAGNVRALAIGTRERVDGIDVPSLGEQGVDVELTNWRGLVAPPGLTPEQRQALIDIVTEMRNGPAWQDTIARNRWQDNFISGDEFGAFLTTETERIGVIADQLGIGA